MLYLTDTKDILAIANENPLGMFKSLPKNRTQEYRIH